MKDMLLEKRPLVISGPSGIGKTTLANQLEPYGFRSVLKTTTRPPRDNEVNGIDYEFMDEADFIESKRNGEFISAGHFYDNYYGLRKSEFSQASTNGEPTMLTLHAPTIKKFLSHFPQAETVYMMPKTEDFLAARLALRQQTAEEYEYRLGKGLQELADYKSTQRPFYKHELVIYSNDNTEHIQKIRTLYENPQSIRV